jgi:hypothetical protein
MSVFEGFVGGTYTTVSKNHATDKAINLFLEQDQSGNAKSKAVLYNTPGLLLFGTLPTSPVRALWAGDDRLFAVGGTVLYEINSAGVPTARPGAPIVNSGDEPAYIYSNKNSLFIVSGGKGYLDDGASVTEVVDADSGTYIDGYFVALKPDSNEFYISGLFDGTTWDPLEFAERMGAPDRLVATVADGGRLWLFGKRTTEVWHNTGNADFPFERIDGARIDQGVLAKHSITALDNSLFFVGADDRGSASVWRTRGYQVERVSNYAIEQSISDWLPEETIAYGYEDAGHRFYVLTVPGGSDTWVYDCSTGLWHQRLYWDTSVFAAQLPRCHAYTTSGFTGSSSKHLVGSRLTGKIYVQSVNLYTDDGVAIRRYRQAPHLADENKYAFHHRLELDMATGSFTGTANVSLKWSDDDGQTFSTDRTISLGSSGEYSRRVIWRQLGRARDRVYGVTFHDVRGPIGIVDAYIDVSAGNGA